MVKTSEEITDILVRAEDDITPSLRKHDGPVTKDENGDLTLAIEEKYPHRLGQFLNENGMGAVIISEGELILKYGNMDERYIVFLDPFEVSTNFHSGKLPYGVNIAVFPFSSGDVLVRDWISALVADRHNGIKYTASHTERGDEVRVIEHGRYRAPNREVTGLIIEVPAGYTKHDSEFFSQIAYYHAIMSALGDNQYRSIDSTGTRLVDVVDGTTRVYVEGRNLKKLGGAWNIIPSVIIIKAGGGIATHIDGCSFENDVVWNGKVYIATGGFNPDVGRDVLACHRTEDHIKCLEAIAAVRQGVAEYLTLKLKGLSD